jgi:hypothetical protein
MYTQIKRQLKKDTMVSIEVIAVANFYIAAYNKCLKHGLTEKSAENYAQVECAKALAANQEIAFKVLYYFSTTENAFNIYLATGGEKRSFADFQKHMHTASKHVSKSYTESKNLIITFLSNIRTDIKPSTMKTLLQNEIMFLDAKKVRSKLA